MAMDKLGYYQLLRKGYLRRVLREREERKNGPKALRGGNSGALHGGKVIGDDPRKAVLRYFGIERPVTFDELLLLDNGVANEDLHNALLDEAGVDYKCEEEYPIRWNLEQINPDTGEPWLITCRPDRVLGKYEGEEFKPLFLCEEKQIASSWKTKLLSLWGEAQPKPENVCQVAHYAWKLELPSALIYTSRAWHALKTKLINLINPNHRAVMSGGEFSFGVKPFMSLYDVNWREDGYVYIDDKRTVITAEKIKAWYEMLADCIMNKKIPNMHYVDVWGKPETKSKKEKYYDWKHVPEDDFDAWLSTIRKECNEAWAELEAELKELEKVAQ